MPDFAYVARDMSGKKVNGTISANTEREAASQLGAKNLFPIEVVASKGAMKQKFGRVKGTLMAGFYSQLANLLRSGVPMLRSITVLTQQSNNKTLKAVLGELKSRVEEGESLGEAMTRYPKVFNNIAVNMVRAGAEGGFLEDSLERVGGFIEQQEELKGKTVGALAYPMFILTVGIIVVSILLVFFVPNFEPMFSKMRAKGKLPMATDLLLVFSAFLQSYWWVAAGIMGTVGTLVYIFLQTETGKVRFDYLKIKTPMIGQVFLQLAVARFTRVLGTLLENGVPLLKSLEISRHAAGNSILATSIEEASEEVQAGESLAKTLGTCGHFPPTVIEMISVAEEANTLDKVLVQVSDNLEKSTFRRLEIVVRLLEPIMLLLLAGVVMFVVIALMVPILTQSQAV